MWGQGAIASERYATEGTRQGRGTRPRLTPLPSSAYCHGATAAFHCTFHDAEGAWRHDVGDTRARRVHTPTAVVEAAFCTPDSAETAGRVGIGFPSAPLTFSPEAARRRMEALTSGAPPIEHAWMMSQVCDSGPGPAELHERLRMIYAPHSPPAGAELLPPSFWQVFVPMTPGRRMPASPPGWRLPGRFVEFPPLSSCAERDETCPPEGPALRPGWLYSDPVPENQGNR